MHTFTGVYVYTADINIKYNLMKRSIKSLLGFTLGATDGEIGKVKDFYFDDNTWTIRYLIVETGSWLFGRKILLSPEAVVAPDWEHRILPVNLTMEQIKDSPDIDTDKPISRQHEIDLHKYYPWTSYWGSGTLWAGGMGTSGMMIPAITPAEQIKENKTGKNGEQKATNPHLLSIDKVTGYHIQATDGSIGDVQDFIINDNTWEIDFMEVDTGHWFPGKKVLLAPEFIREIIWDTSTVIVDASEKQVRNSPEYQPDQDISESYKTNLQNYYGRFISQE